MTNPTFEFFARLPAALPPVSLTGCVLIDDLWMKVAYDLGSDEETALDLIENLPVEEIKENIAELSN
jgi:hypothetical protein|tara:strand:- start:615 stop:815 length:201 start_codon:yes stop_codon:yes gene_type:complete